MNEKITLGKINLETGNYSYVKNNKVKNGYIGDVDDTNAYSMIVQFEQVQSDIELQKTSDIYEYTIHNGGSYENAISISVYSQFFYTEEEFEKICQEAIKNLEEEGNKYISQFEIVSEINKRNDFCKVEFAQSHNCLIDRIAKDVKKAKINSYEQFKEFIEKKYLYLDDIDYVWEKIKSFYL